MGIASEEQWPVDALLLTVAAGGFADSQDVRLIEAGVERRPAVSRSAKGDTLGFDARVGLKLVVGGQQPIDVHQLGRVGHTPGRGADLGHRLKPYPSRRAPLHVAGMTTAGRTIEREPSIRTAGCSGSWCLRRRSPPPVRLQ